MKQQYVIKTFRQKSLDLIETINKVIEDYQAQGYELTLRQLYYQLVARGYIENTERSYKNVGSLINDGRLAGLIDWDAIVDRTRYIRRQNHFSDPADVLSAAHDSYRLDKWKDQPCYVELWIEKDALIDIAEKAANSLDVPCFSCRGYCSQSEMYEAAQRFIRQGDREARFIIHLGDHDPSGLDMTRDIQERLYMFGANVQVKRVALNMNQIQQFNPPPNPAKTTDARAGNYIKQYGHESWELDALDPQVLENLITDEIMGLIDAELYLKVKERERREKIDLDYLSGSVRKHGGKVIDLIRKHFKD